MKTPFENNSSTSATYAEAIDFFKKLAEKYPKNLQFQAQGPTESGYPLHTAVLSADGDFDPFSNREKGRAILFINNGIHPGEPEGIDATMMLARDILERPELKALLDKVTIVIIPVYNIDGALNRGKFSRVNQEGPDEYGFRGNARNFDLNRDFIKNDTKNARSFTQIFQNWKPDIMVDNHTSNGADYQYTMTLIATHPDKLPLPLARYQQNELLPRLYKDMAGKGWEMTPYVNSDDTPDKGIYGFFDHPRYSSGYASLFGCIAFMPETHMLKPFPDRVKSTYAFMEVMLHTVYDDAAKYPALRQQTLDSYMQALDYPLQWRVNTLKPETITFKGYEAGTKPSAVSGLPRLYYDRNKPYTKEIPYYNTFTFYVKTNVPESYIIPQAYTEVIELLASNGVEMQALARDRDIAVEQYYIKDYKTTKEPYEGHYLHSDVQLRTVTRTVTFHRGDYIVKTRQPAMRYIMEVLEPQAPDSYFAWNFFDPILQAKEHFSEYVFEDLAADFLTANPHIRKELEEYKRSDPEFAKDASAQLEFVYRRSPWYEQSHNLYPVSRVVSY